MLCGRRGRRVAIAKRDQDAIRLDAFIARLQAPDAPLRTPGIAIYRKQQSESVPAALTLNLKHNGVVHRHFSLLQVITTERLGFQKPIV